MKALWGAGPNRSQPAFIRGSNVMVLGQVPQEWKGDPGREAPTEVWTVREITVGDRRWRVILPPEWTLDQALLALIDALPHHAREAEVSP